jgi:hypothetical protein
MKTLRSKKGQGTVEYLLITTVLVAIMVFLTKQVQQQQILAKFVAEPWGTLAGVIENGVPGNAAAKKDRHPNGIDRHASLKGEKLR